MSGPEQPPSLRGLIAYAVMEVMGSNEVVVYAEPLALAFADELRRAGLALHDPRRCARLPEAEPGRPMTAEEQTMVGLEGG